jgi:hypothetical protein
LPHIEDKKSMTKLNSRLQAANRSEVITDTVSLIDQEVAKKGGLGGAALKAGYRIVKKLQSGKMISKAVDYLLDDFTAALEPIYDAFCRDESATHFADYLNERSDEAADCLLAITDKRIGTAENRLIQKTYKKLRGQAHKHVTEAVGGVGAIIDRHVPKTEAA